MYTVANLKKVKTFYNKFVTNIKRTSTNIKVEGFNGNLIHTIAFGLSALKVTLSGQDEDFAPLSMIYNDWYNAFDQFKGVKETDISVSNNTFKLGNEYLSCEESNSNKFDWTTIANIQSEPFSYAILTNSVCAKQGKLLCNSYMYFCLKENTLNIINTNDIILQSSIVNDVEGDDIVFAIPNEFISTLKKWVMLANDSDVITLSSCSVNNFNFLNLSFEGENGIVYEMICPMVLGSEYDKTYNVLSKLINTQYMGKPVKLDENDMYQEMVNEAGHKLLTNGKKGVTKKSIKKILDDYNKESDKVAAFKMIDNKIFDVTYLNLSKSVGDDNVYILRTLYTDYTNATSEFDTLVYYLSSKANALLFGHKDDMFEFKTLFMLRKPKEAIITEIPDEVEDEEEIIVNNDDDTFEPT